jgi:hypothetical protein
VHGQALALALAAIRVVLQAAAMGRLLIMFGVPRLWFVAGALRLRASM